LPGSTKSSRSGTACRLPTPEPGKLLVSWKAHRTLINSAVRPEISHVVLRQLDSGSLLGLRGKLEMAKKRLNGQSNPCFFLALGKVDRALILHATATFVITI
jgi:hypothetical protein